MKYESVVRRVTGKTKHSYGTIENGIPVKHTPMPPAFRLLIEESNGGFLLLRYSVDGEYAGDTWHADLAEAKRQAEFEYEVESEDWREIPDNT